MKVTHLIAALVVATLLGGIIYTFYPILKTPDNNLTFVNLPTPPLQNGPIPLNGYYKVRSYQSLNQTHYVAYLTYTGSETTYSMQKNILFTNILVRITINGENELTIKITDQDSDQFQVPYSNIFPRDKVFTFPIQNSFEVQIVNPEFGIKIIRKSSQEVIFDTSKLFFVYSQLYTQIGIQMQDEYIYGLGERRQQFLYKNGEYTFLNKDQYMSMADGEPNTQTYGTHPMYLRREQSGLFHVVFLRNYNSLQAQYVSGDSLTFITAGGLLEFKIFVGDKYPETSLKQYHSYINGFALHPFWSHGYHQCRWGYSTSEKMIDVWQEFIKDDLPVDTIWSDIDYMTDFTDFTIDTTRYSIPDMNKMLDTADPKGLHWVPIIDAGIAFGDNSYYRGLELGVFQISNKTGQPLIGCVWPGIVNYVDFNHPKSNNYWAEGLMNITKVYGIVPSGFWIDMNEFSNFVNGEISSTETCVMPGDPDPDRQYLGVTVEDFYTNIPFEVGGADHPLQEKTMSMDAPKYNKIDSNIVQSPKVLREFDFHNLNGFAEGIATNYALKKMGNQLPFIISRSQIAGSGQFVQHWTGDNGSYWPYLQTSLSEIFNFNVFGIPMTGVDICGFAQNTTAQLCARWMQVGSLYPFSRNHNSNDTIPQEPYAFPDDPYVLSSSRASLKIRYALLKQYYSYFVINNGVGTIFRPLFFNFPDDLNLLSQDQSFMIYDSLLVIPVLIEQTNPELSYTTIDLYFPQGGAFYDFNQQNGKRYTNADSNTQLNVPFDSVSPIFIREGYTLFTQFNSNQNRARLLNNHFELHIALASNGNNVSSQGQIITLLDYNDTDLINKCQGQNNCAATISISGYIVNSSLVLNFNITGSTSKTFFGEFYIDSYFFYLENYNVKPAKANKTIKITGATTFQQSFPLSQNEPSM